MCVIELSQKLFAFWEKPKKSALLFGWAGIRAPAVIRRGQRLALPFVSIWAVVLAPGGPPPRGGPAIQSAPAGDRTAGNLTRGAAGENSSCTFSPEGKRGEVVPSGKLKSLDCWAVPIALH